MKAGIILLKNIRSEGRNMQLKDLYETLSPEMKHKIRKCHSFIEALDVLEENDINFPDDMSAGNFFLENTIICPDCGSVDVVENSDGSYTCQTCGRVFIV